MKKSLLIGSALLLTTSAVGFAIAASGSPSLHHNEHRHHGSVEADRGQSTRIADRSEGEGRRASRQHHDDDEEEHERGESRNRLPATGPADPNAPLPENGLFGSKARPQVEVR